MTHLTLAASFLVVWQAQAATSLEGVKKAERFAAAIEGKADFQDADFTKALSIQEKTALKGFGKCKVAQIGYATVAHPIQKNVVEQDVSWWRKTFTDALAGPSLDTAAAPVRQSATTAA